MPLSAGGWNRRLQRERNTGLFRYIGQEVSADRLPAVFIRLAMMSVADTVVFPLQDILGLGAQSRMNRPGTDAGNWRWRLEKDQIGSP